MKNRSLPRSKPETKPEKRLGAPEKRPAPPDPAASAAVDGVPPAAMRKLEDIGREIAGLRSELARLADERERERRRKSGRGV